jgi:hypothetical protein
MSDLGSKLEHWHARAAKVVGAVALTIERRGLTRGMLTGWADELEQVARDMRGAEDELNHKARVK